MQTAEWDEIEQDLKLGVFLMTVAAQALLPDGEEAGSRFGAAALGKGYDPKQSAAYQVDELEHLFEMDVSGTRFWKVTRACFDFVHDRTPLDRLNTDDFQDEALNWMNYFLAAIPRDEYATSLGVYSGRFIERRDRGEEQALPGLHLSAAAKANLADYLQRFPVSPDIDIGFAPFEIAALAGMNISSVRNFVGPGGNKPIRSMPGDKRFGVYGDPLDTLEWLAGRRNFDPGPLSAEWPAWAADRANTIEHVGALLGIYAWTNRVTSEALADRSGLPLSMVREWTRGTIGSIEDAAAMAEAAGIDPDLYTDLVARHLGTAARI